jgi:hypothetical protein
MSVKSKANQYGQFFTKNDMCKWTLDIVNNIKKIKGDLLEPSFGSGNFVDEMTKFDNVKVDAVEIDKIHFNSYKNINAILVNQDFLLFNNNKKYDFIVGNPPYIEICYSFYDKSQQEDIKKEFKGISNGRINLVHIFMKKSFEILKDDGIIAYLLPSAILTSPTYKYIRKEIYQNFNVEYIKEDVSFPDVAIKVCLLVIRKTKNSGKYFYINNDNYFLMENYLNFKKSKTLKDYGFNVSIGEVVWNQQRELITDDINEKVLIYSTNIGHDKIDIQPTRGRKQHIKNKEVRYTNCIIFPRTVSKKIKFYFVKNNQNYIFENHVLVLTHPDLDMLEKFYNNLKSGIYNELLNSFFNSSNLTKGELLSLPFNK